MINWAIDESINQSIDRSTKQWINQSMDQSMGVSVNWSIDQPNNQPTNQIRRYFWFTHTSNLCCVWIKSGSLESRILSLTGNCIKLTLPLIELNVHYFSLNFEEMHKIWGYMMTIKKKSNTEECRSCHSITALTTEQLIISFYITINYA